MVQQVRLKENYTVPNSTVVSVRKVFGFGTHETATEADAHPVTSAAAAANGFRIIMDELLVGNNLEEIACRSQVDSDAYARVPLGATPDDIAKCSAAQDVLPATCKGESAVCLCEIAGGCLVGNSMVEQGAPVGVLDVNQDGATDDTRLITTAVGVQCGAIDVPMDLDMSYWNPSGNQQVPAMGGFDALGPALVLVPLPRGLPTNIECGLRFDPSVVDKQGEGVCTPPDGDLASSCAAGDLTAFKFRVEPLALSSTFFENGATGVSRTDKAVFTANTHLDPTTAVIANVQITPVPPGGPPAITLTMNKNIELVYPGTGLAANTNYTITITVGVKDTFGQALPQPLVTTFMTGS